MKSIFICVVLMLIGLSPVKAKNMQDNWSNKWKIYVLASFPDASNKEVLKEMNSHLPNLETNAEKSGFIDVQYGAGVTYFYSSRWSTSLSIAGIGDFSSHEICGFFCGERKNISSSLESITHYYLTQNYSMPLWENGFAVLKVGASLTSYKLEQETYSDETGVFENIYNSTENEWGAVAGVKVTHLFAETFSLSLGYDQFTTFDSSISYLELGYMFELF